MLTIRQSQCCPVRRENTNPVDLVSATRGGSINYMHDFIILISKILFSTVPSKASEFGPLSPNCLEILKSFVILHCRKLPPDLSRAKRRPKASTVLSLCTQTVLHFFQSSGTKGYQDPYHLKTSTHLPERLLVPLLQPKDAEKVGKNTKDTRSRNEMTILHIHFLPNSLPQVSNPLRKHVFMRGE